MALSVIYKGPMKTKCPQCKIETIYSEENPFRPFCSKRCKLIDLGEWASESYTLPSEEPLSEDELLEAYKKQEES